MAKVTTEAEQHQRFRACAADHGLRLHRIHLLSATKSGTFQSSIVFDCTCGERWLLRVTQGELVPVDGSLLAELRQGRQGQSTAPPGHPAAPEPAH